MDGEDGRRGYIRTNAYNPIEDLLTGRELISVSNAALKHFKHVDSEGKKIKNQNKKSFPIQARSL